MTKAPTLDEFEGDWTLSRKIEDRLAGLDGTMEGRASFRADAEGLRYDEEGALRFGEHPAMEATRRYLWRECDGAIEIRFDDGRPFHRIAPDKLMPHDLHHCAPDMYHVTYEFTKWPMWRAIWRVQGPRTDYRSVSEYRRA